MLGIKFKKPLETQEQLDGYAQMAAWCNENHATIEDKGEYYEVVKIPAPSEAERKAIEIERLKAELSATDYKCLKFVDGEITKKEYAEIKKHRSDLRARINELEQE